MRYPPLRVTDEPMSDRDRPAVALGGQEPLIGTGSIQQEVGQGGIGVANTGVILGSIFVTASGSRAAFTPGDINDDPAAVAFHPNRTHIVVGGRNFLSLWDIEKKTLVRDIAYDNAVAGTRVAVKAIAVCPDGSWMAAALSVGLHDRVAFWDARATAWLADVPVPSLGRILGLGVSRDARRVYVAGIKRAAVIRIPRLTATTLPYPSAAKASSDVSIIGDRIIAAAQCRVTVCDGTQRNKEIAVPFSSRVCAVAVSPDESQLAIGCEDRSVQLRNAASPTLPAPALMIC